MKVHTGSMTGAHTLAKAVLLQEPRTRPAPTSLSSLGSPSSHFHLFPPVLQIQLLCVCCELGGTVGPGQDLPLMELPFPRGENPVGHP